MCLVLQMVDKEPSMALILTYTRTLVRCQNRHSLQTSAIMVQWIYGEFVIGLKWLKIIDKVI